MRFTVQLVNYRDIFGSALQSKYLEVVILIQT
jgi:hypothetical protein